MPKDFEEWLRQADYDLDTADFMFKGKRCTLNQLQRKFFLKQRRY